MLPWHTARVPVPFGGSDGILLMFTELRKEQAHLTTVKATKSPVFGTAFTSVHVSVEIHAVFELGEELLHIDLVYLCDGPPLWLLCWLLCCIARTCRTWCDWGSLPLVVHLDSRETLRLLNRGFRCLCVEVLFFNFFFFTLIVRSRTLRKFFSPKNYDG